MNLKYILLLIVVLLSSCSKKESTCPVTLRWEMGENNVEPSYYSNTFILKNSAGSPLEKEWAIYYSQLPREIKIDSLSPIKIEVINADFFKLSPSKYYQTIAPGDSLIISFRCTNGLIKEAHAPSGAYFVSIRNGAEQTPLPIELTTVPFYNETQWSRPGADELPYPYGDILFENNSYFAQAKLNDKDIFPSLKQYTPANGSLDIGKELSIIYPATLQNEAAILREKLENEYEIAFTDTATVTIQLTNLPTRIRPVNDEHYQLEITDKAILIQGNTSHAIFNGTQTLLALIKGKKHPITLAKASISDYPDLMYRGQMIDVARNFINKKNLLTLIDLFASYKLNTLHLHLTDDEGWRLEVPGMEELTTVGARRGHSLDESEYLYPAYGSSFSPVNTQSAGNGHYSRKDFIDILHYAQKRHIQIIPEIDLPGHSRAAIVAMKARHNKYKGADKDKAEEYLLTEAADTSRYISAQSYTDNVINVALPSTYRFVDKVLGELAEMFHTAGIKNPVVHIGGDEVPKGAWTGSPLCSRLMKEQSITQTEELNDYFLERVIESARKYNLSVAGWQEVGLKEGEKVNNRFVSKLTGIYCWNTVPEWGGDIIPYSLANAGYDVILCNVNNFYFDLSYSKHQQEPGLHWAGFVDEVASFNMQPFNIYCSARKDLNGNSVDLRKASIGKVALRPEKQRHIKGVQGQLFAENITQFDGTLYALFPKMFGLIERGWNAYPYWSDGTEKEYNTALSLYETQIAEKELPYLAGKEVNFRIAQPGIKEKEGLIFMNSTIPGASIRYTTDGSEPSQASMLWKEPIDIKEGKRIKAKAFYLGKSSVTTRCK